jgi:NDP-sugar pyrophosphorylase family protein
MVSKRPISQIDTEGQRVRTALLLAAGQGNRLQPLTHDAPKCLTEINGAPILDRLICCLQEHDFERLIVVVGHLDDQVRDFLGERKGGLKIEYVQNPLYRTTNNIYSLWLARKRITESFLLIECDLIFDATQLGGMLTPDRIAVSPRLPWMNGTTVTVDRFQRLTAFQVGSDASAFGHGYKTVNICSLSLPSWRRVAARLDARIAAGRVNDYYETVFAEMVADGTLSLEAVVFDTDRWYEIDTLNDLHAAERVFSQHPEPQT